VGENRIHLLSLPRLIFIMEEIGTLGKYMFFTGLFLIFLGIAFNVLVGGLDYEPPDTPDNASITTTLSDDFESVAIPLLVNLKYFFNDFLGFFPYGLTLIGVFIYWLSWW